MLPTSPMFGQAFSRGIQLKSNMLENAAEEIPDIRKNSSCVLRAFVNEHCSNF